MSRLLILGLVLLCPMLGACGETPAQRTEHEKSKVTALVTALVDEMLYFKDPRTQICYSYLWLGSGHGGPALTAVPCEQVPPELLR